MAPVAIAPGHLAKRERGVYRAPMGRTGIMRAMVRQGLALLVAYALAFAPALADVTRGTMAAGHRAMAAMGELCLASADGGRPAEQGPNGQPRQAHEDCCLAGCRLGPQGAALPAEAAALPRRIGVAIEPGESPRTDLAGAPPCPTPPATGPPIRA
jgi:hypothetical protein